MIKRNQKRKRPNTPPRSPGWHSSDDEEILRRQQRAAKEALKVESLAESDGFYGEQRVDSGSGQIYRVEVRSLTEHINSCSCPDHQINGLGTCKHIEAALLRLQHRRKRAFKLAADQGTTQIEIFLDRRDEKVRIIWPANGRIGAKVKQLLTPFFTPDNLLNGEPLDRLPALQRAVESAHWSIRKSIRVSQHLAPWLAMLDRREQQIRRRRHFETEVAAGNTSLDLVKHKLYSYQQEGMLHLAFTGRALLADEMGLGKTVQAVAACELLRRTQGIRRVLVVSPASLKGEWEEQIAKFTDLSSQIIQGARAKRLRQYTNPAFFHLASYEQIRSDVEEINSILSPDVIILDEAQRIKNWQTKTAISIKRLKSPSAFVLTGTPVENRIDEIYSIVQFLDPHLFGPLFRFNRDFYQLDERGRAEGYKNLDQLHQRLQPIMLRRRKDQVEGQLPGRTVNTYFVPMHKEQSLRYGEYELRVTRIAAMAKKRPLTKEEMEQLQRNLACMRMLCDTPYILDQECFISPKLDELDTILQELMESGDHKVIIFSEWERMLQLVRGLAEGMGLGYALHTGKIPQPKRRVEIQRFKNDPQCRLFLSTDSGAVGLNLQAANVVINLDMPWNPAKLEQRIARAWRKHQKRTVQVINLVSEGTIEHRMLSLLEQKSALAKGIVDGMGESKMSLPSGRAAFLERIGTLMGSEQEQPPAPTTDPMEKLRDNLIDHWSDQLELMELHGEGAEQTLLVVTERMDEAMQEALNYQISQQFPDQTPQLKLLDKEAYATIQQLIKAGILSANSDNARTLYQASETGKPKASALSKRLSEARKHLTQSEHKQKMATVLANGGFAIEAIRPMSEAVETALHSLLIWQGHSADTETTTASIDSLLVEPKLLPAETLQLLSHLREDQPITDEKQAIQLLSQCDDLMTLASKQLCVVNKTG
ncbi:MAG: DEAD/DEAH box helicase [Sedimenticola sp.]